MELHLKINDVVGMDDQKRHILHVDGDQLLKALMEHKGWIAQNLIRDYLLKHDTKLLNQIIDDNDLRNTIYQDEKARREGKAERREHHRLFEIERQRRQDQHKASIATRKALNFYRDILGITEDD